MEKFQKMYKVEIIKGNIVDCDTEAIVNAANEGLIGGSGVCGTIFKAAGYKKMQEACNKIGHCNIGEAVITEGFNLKAQYVIHTVGPKYIDMRRAHKYTVEEIEKIGFDNIIINEELSNKQLNNAYINSLILAEKNGIKSIAFPTISAGTYGYPIELATKIELEAINDYNNNNPNTCIEKVVICTFTNETYEALIKFMKNSN